MIKNYTGFFGGQGNSGEFQTGMKGLLLGIMVIILLGIGIFREKIAKRFDRQGKILGFKSQDHMGRGAGVIGLTFSAFRLIIMGVCGYPLYGEGLALHLCRLHLGIIFFFMIFGKVKGIKYITYIAIIGAIFGIMFANMKSDMISSKDMYVNGATKIDFGKYTTYEALSTFTHADGKTPGTQLEKMAYLEGLTQYNTGFDNYFTYDFTLAHESLVFFPLFIRAAYRQTYTNKEFFRTQIAYILATTFMGVLNVALGQASSPHGRSNFGFIGLDANNDEYKALGPLSAGPQNLFAYILIGIAVTFAFHSLGFATAKVQFFEREKWYQIKIVKSEPRKAGRAGFKTGGFKEIFIVKRK